MGSRLCNNHDGAMALSLIDAGARYGLVLSDFRLARGMNGLDLITAIRARHQGVPPAVAMLTATLDPEQVAAARAAGIPVIPKPLRAPHLRQLPVCPPTCYRERFGR